MPPVSSVTAEFGVGCEVIISNFDRGGRDRYGKAEIRLKPSSRDGFSGEVFPELAIIVFFNNCFEFGDVLIDRR